MLQYLSFLLTYIRLYVLDVAVTAAVYGNHSSCSCHDDNSGFHHSKRVFIFTCKLCNWSVGNGTFFCGNETYCQPIYLRLLIFDFNHFTCSVIVMHIAPSFLHFCKFKYFELSQHITQPMQ